MKWLPSLLALVCVAALGAIACDSDDDANPSGVTTNTPATAPTSVPTIPITYAPAGPATFGVRAGSTEGSRDVEAFMPADIRLRVGDTIEWTAHGFEGHTVTFGDDDDVIASFAYLIPNPADAEEVIFNPILALRSERQGPHDGTSAFINSGFFGVPVEQKYSLAFGKEGLYTYLCLVHPFTMNGTVTVEPADAQVDSPETVAARGAAEGEAYLAELAEEATRVEEAAQAAPGPGGSNIHYVQVGAITDHGQVAAYFPAALDVSVGDTVIFQNDDRNFHNVIFKGAGELPPGIGILPDAGGRGLNFSLSKASAKFVDPPAGGFDDTTFLSSGSIGVLQPRLNWTLRFTTPGTYAYACTIHTLAGMAGVITVQ